MTEDQTPNDPPLAAPIGSPRLLQKAEYLARMVCKLHRFRITENDSRRLSALASDWLSNYHNNKIVGMQIIQADLIGGKEVVTCPRCKREDFLSGGWPGIECNGAWKTACDCGQRLMVILPNGKLTRDAGEKTL